MSWQFTRRHLLAIVVPALAAAAGCTTYFDTKTTSDDILQIRSETTHTVTRGTTETYSGIQWESAERPPMACGVRTLLQPSQTASSTRRTNASRGGTKLDSAT